MRRPGRAALGLVVASLLAQVGCLGPEWVELATAREDLVDCERTYPDEPWKCDEKREAFVAAYDDYDAEYEREYRCHRSYDGRRKENCTLYPPD